MTPAEFDRLPRGLQVRAVRYYLAADYERDATIAHRYPECLRARPRAYRRRAKAVRPRSLLQNGRAYRGH